MGVILRSCLLFAGFWGVGGWLVCPRPHAGCTLARGPCVWRPRHQRLAVRGLRPDDGPDRPVPLFQDVEDETHRAPHEHTEGEGLSLQHDAVPDRVAPPAAPAAAVPKRLVQSSPEDHLLEEPDRLRTIVLQQEGLEVDRRVARVPGLEAPVVTREAEEEEEDLGYDPLDDEDGRLIVSKITRMLQRKVDLWPPNELFELMPVLLRGERLERAVKRRMKEVTLKERGRLQHSLDFLMGIKHAEQGRLSRQWLQGMLESMETVDAMDEAVHQLVATEKGALVEPVLETLDEMLRQLQQMSPDEKTLTQHVLQAIKHRVEAEVQTRDQPFVRLLAACLRLKTPEERERLLRLELLNVDVIEEFAAFVEEGIDYTTRARLGPFKLADDTPEQMKAIAAIVRSFIREVPAPPPRAQLQGGRDAM